MYYTDLQMQQLAVHYLRMVNELPRGNMPLRDLLQYTVNVYNRRKEEGLEQ